MPGRLSASAARDAVARRRERCREERGVYQMCDVRRITSSEVAFAGGIPALLGALKKFWGYRHRRRWRCRQPEVASAHWSGGSSQKPGAKKEASRQRAKSDGKDMYVANGRLAKEKAKADTTGSRSRRSETCESSPLFRSDIWE